MNREFLLNAAFLVLVNGLIKPFYVFGIERTIQERVGPEQYGLYATLFSFTFLLFMVNDFGIHYFNNRTVARHPQLIGKYFPNTLMVKALLTVFYLVLVFVAAWVRCSEPGFLAKSVLRWNGIESEQDCDDPQRVAEREAPFGTKGGLKVFDSEISIYPNPANQTLNVEFKQETNSGTISFFEVQGRLHKLVRVRVSEGHSQLSIGELPTGLYILKVQTDSDRPHFAKLEVFR